ncbi:hypothetical protein G6F22_011507 [Rhizopus arrhizus]|nr:hypothetical protein G6F22_011507 [Rhizopus arrhizus]
MQADLLAGRLAGHAVLQAIAAVASDVEQRVALRRAIAHGAVRYPGGILHPRPERTAIGTDVVFVQRLVAVPALGPAVVDVLLGVAVAAQHQHVAEVLEQVEQALAVGVTERLAPRRSVEQRDVHAQHQQAVLVQALQVAGKERELVFAQAADVLRLGLGVIHHVVEEHETGATLFHRIGVRAIDFAPAVQRVFVAGRIEVEVVVARHMEPRHAQRRGDLVDRRVQGQVVVDDVAQRGAHARLGLADQRRHDRLLVVADVLQAGSLRIGEHQHLEAATAVMALRLQGEIPVAGDVAGGCDAAVLQRRRTVRAIMPPERRQAGARLREGVGIGLDHEHGLAIAHRQAVAAVGGGPDRSRPGPACRRAPDRPCR